LSADEVAEAQALTRRLSVEPGCQKAAVEGIAGTRRIDHLNPWRSGAHVYRRLPAGDPTAAARSKLDDRVA